MNNLGSRCVYAKQCPVYNGSTEVKDMPLYLVRNVFCNTGKKGWVNCARFNLLEAGETPGEHVGPYDNLK